MKQEMAGIQSLVGGMSHEMLSMLLPTQRDISELIPGLGCLETETHGDVRHAEAIHRLVAEIVFSPTNHEAWRDLAHAFGLNQMLRWKYLYIADCLKPNDFHILKDLSYSLSMLGDMQGAISLMECAAACAASEPDRLEGIENTVCLRFPQLMECNTTLMM